MKKKFDHLVEIINIKSENIEEEEIKIKKYYEEINNINNLPEAIEKYNEIKEQFDIDKWREFNSKSFVYILGEKLQKYENISKENITIHENVIKEFEKLHESINNEIQKSSENLIYIQNLVSKLNKTLNNIEDSINNIKQIDPSDQNDISEIQLKINSDNEKFKEYTIKVINELIEKEFNSINEQLKNMLNVLKEFPKLYDNQFSSYLCSKIKIN